MIQKTKNKESGYNGGTDPQTAILIMTYTLAKALAISPLEIYKMPATMVTELLMVHGVMEQYKADELDKEMKKNKKY